MYSPINAEGSKRDHLVGFLRGDRIAVFVPRLPLKLGDNWSATTVEVPPGKWQNVLTSEVVIGGRMRVQKLLQRFPVASGTGRTRIRISGLGSASKESLAECKRDCVANAWSR